MSGVKDALGGEVRWVVAVDATSATALLRPAPSSTRQGDFTPALLAALAIHVVILGVILADARPVHLPEATGPAAVSVVFEPEAPSQPAPASEEAAAAPPILPSQPDEAQAPDLQPPPILAQAEPVPDVQTLIPPVAETTPAPDVPSIPRSLELPRLARSFLHPVPPLPRTPQHLQREPTVTRTPAQSMPQVATTAIPSAPPGTSTRQPSAAQAVSVASPSMGAWRSALVAWLERHKKYPEAAREEGAEGHVLVRFTVSRDGRVLEASLVQSSGSHALDAAALSLLGQAHLPPFPAGVTQSTLTATLPLTYQLE